MCTLWNANSPWISLANPSAAASPANIPCMRQLFPSWQGGQPSCALDQYEPVGALFEQLGLGLYQPWLLEMFFEKTTTLGLSLFFLCKSWRDGSGEMPAIPVGYVVGVTGRSLHLWMPEHQEKAECLCGVLIKTAYFEKPCTPEKTGDSSLWDTRRKMGIGYAVLNNWSASLQPFLLNVCPYFSEGFWTENYSSPCLDVLLSKGFEMWTRFRKMLYLMGNILKEEINTLQITAMNKSILICSRCSFCGHSLLLKAAAGLCSRSHHGLGLWTVQLFSDYWKTKNSLFFIPFVAIMLWV